MKVDADDKELLDSVERGEWKSAGGGKPERTRYTRVAKATFRKDRRLNIRLSSKVSTEDRIALGHSLGESVQRRRRPYRARTDTNRKRCRQDFSGDHRPGADCKWFENRFKTLWQAFPSTCSRQTIDCR